MRSISILDCTLRDGGYINSWKFGKQVIPEIIKQLELAGIDIIECGFIEDVEGDLDSSVFNSVESMSHSFEKKNNTMYVGMIAIGDIAAEKITPRTKNSIDGIRLTFHKHEIDEEFRQAKILIDKGYQVFIQPVGTSTYSDKELIDLIYRVNELKPFAFYIVDTLGTMYPKDIQRLFSIIDNNLDQDIQIGFHSHNNLQLSFTNAQTFLDSSLKRNMIIDSSVFGMGRGAGNLTSELITQYINTTYSHTYDVIPLLTIMDRYLNSIFVKTPWGYSSPYYLSAINNCHPNYANNLMSKKTLNVESIFKILNLIPENERSLYNKSLIEEIYKAYQSYKIDDALTVKSLSTKLEGRNILLLASGESINSHHEKIDKWVKKNDAIVIHINSIKPGYPCDVLFISNCLKYEQLEAKNNLDSLIITTSNIKNSYKNAQCVDYSSLLCNGIESDNAGLMAISLMCRIGIKSVVLAGFDGFVYDSKDYIQYVSESYLQKNIDNRNKQISKELSILKQKIELVFITPTIYELV